MLVGLTLFWGAMLVGAAVNPAYSHRRDYVSTLASHGAEHAWLGMAAIVAAAGAMLAAGMLVRPLSRAAAVSIAAAGVGFVVAAFTRLDSPDGAAGCGLVDALLSPARRRSRTGRPPPSAPSCSSRDRRRRRDAPADGAGTGGSHLARSRCGHRRGVPDHGRCITGDTQREGIVVATGWLAGVAIATLSGRE